MRDYVIRYLGHRRVVEERGGDDEKGEHKSRLKGMREDVNAN